MESTTSNDFAEPNRSETLIILCILLKKIFKKSTFKPQFKHVLTERIGKINF